ncbi:adenylate kinase 8 isoform X2 [Protopterus annectens]|uniref:adenylate kinase 8 isoform X2 n=1 Tax=Protopterus annectens TaxID=7888 RepID=UPI001CFB499E|nr:adenylate kinase 8 isoform X2 [Protopterus annectens]
MMDATAKPLRVPPEISVYAEQHGIFDLIQKMVSSLLTDRPEDPIQYLIDMLKKSGGDEVPRIFILGPPASGKKTIAKMLCDQINAVLLKPEDFFLDDVSERVKEALSYKMSNKGWVLVGFPTTREQAVLLQEASVMPQHVVLLDAPDTVLIERNLGKRIDPYSGDVYHTTFEWPSDPNVQKQLVKPDNISEKETAKELLAYRRHYHGIFNTYNNICKTINADQPCIDVFSQVLTYVQQQHRSAAPFTPRILLYGPPGSGRSLQAALIAQKYSIVNICCGQLLKEAAAGDTKLGELLKPYIEYGQQVPDNLVIKILKDGLSNFDCTTRGWVLHGFPRDVEQATELKDAGFVPNRVVFLDITDDAVMERLTLRMTDPVTGERYHSVYKPPPNPKVQSRLQRNPKDSEDNVQHHLDVYHASVWEMEKFYDNVIHINADQDPHTVFEYIESCIVNPIPKKIQKPKTAELHV